jgi:superfamily II DNA or RNA helicase
MEKETRDSGGGLVRADVAALVPWEGALYPPRAWQAAALPVVVDALRARRRGIVCAVMGAGKSVLVAEVVRLATRRLSGRAVVVCAPSRRLVRQLARTLGDRIGADRVGMYYTEAKEAAADVVVCCNASMGALWHELETAGRGVALLVLDEAHKSEARTVREIVPTMAPVCVLGVTATPFRSVPRETVSVFDEVLYRYDMADAQRDGVLVPMRVERWSGSSDTPVDAACVAMIEAHGDGPGIVSARSIEDAETYAADLTAAGIEAAAIHSQLGRAEQDRRIEELRTGRYRCLVHVALLAEGVDLPWLRWICLRRRVGARVRFLQEVGRVLRTHPGKSEGVVLDPHLLLGVHGLETAEALGEAMAEAAAAESEETETEEVRRYSETEDYAVSLELLVSHMQSIRAMLLRRGFVAEGEGYRPGWRMAGITARQVETIKRAGRCTRHIPREHRGAVKTLKSVPYALSRGEASDLLDVLYGGYRYAQEVAVGDAVYRAQWPAAWVPLPSAEVRTAAGDVLRGEK